MKVKVSNDDNGRNGRNDDESPTTDFKPVDRLRVFFFYVPSLSDGWFICKIFVHCYCIKIRFTK